MPTVKLSDETKSRLDKRRHKGQSYDGVISELLNHQEATGVRARRK